MPVHRSDPLSAVYRDHEQRHRRQHGDASVGEPGKRLHARDRHALEQWAAYPEKAVTEKTANTIFSPGAKGAQLAILLVEVLLAALDFADVSAKQDTRNQQPGDRQEDKRKRSAD